MAYISGRLWDFSLLLLLLLLFLMNAHIYIRLAANLVGVGGYKWQTLTPPAKDGPFYKGLYLCELSV